MPLTKYKIKKTKYEISCRPLTVEFSYGKGAVGIK